MAKINVEDQWLLFKSKMYPTGRMHPEQEYQLKNTFYSSFVQAFLLLRDAVSNIFCKLLAKCDALVSK